MVRQGCLISSLCPCSYEHEEGYKQYLELAEASGVSARAVAKAANEIFPTAYYGLRALWQGGFYKFIEVWEACLLPCVCGWGGGGGAGGGGEGP